LVLRDKKLSVSLCVFVLTSNGNRTEDVPRFAYEKI
jgi:hypothetical protein